MSGMTDDLAALNDLLIGVEMDRHSLPDGEAKVMALGRAIARLHGEAQADPCKCVDCGGNEPGHSNDCTYMAELRGEAQAEQQAVALGWVKPDQLADIRAHGSDGAIGVFVASGESAAYSEPIYTRPQPAAVAGDAVTYAPFRTTRGQLAGIRSVIENVQKGDDRAIDTAMGTLHELETALSSTATPDTWKVGDRVVIPGGKLGTIHALRPNAKRYHVLTSEKMGGYFGWWELIAAPAPVAGDAVAKLVKAARKVEKAIQAGGHFDVAEARTEMLHRCEAVEAALAQDRASPKCHASPTGKHQSAEDEPALSERWCQWCSAEFSADAQDRASQAGVPDGDYHEGLSEGIKIGRAEMAERVAVPDGWSGWATQYPGKMPVLRGAREIAELNFYPEEGARLIFLAEVEAPTPAAEREVGHAG